LFNPSKQKWQRHFYWGDGGTWVNGRTVCGRATVAALNFNNAIAFIIKESL
jgi:hypothetical protein